MVEAQEEDKVERDEKGIRKKPEIQKKGKHAEENTFGNVNEEEVEDGKKMPAECRKGR